MHDNSIMIFLSYIHPILLTIDIVPAAGKRFLNKSNLLKAITGLALPTREVRARWIVAIRSFLSRSYRRNNRKQKQQKRRKGDDDEDGDDDNSDSNANTFTDIKSAHHSTIHKASAFDLDDQMMIDKSYHQSIDTTNVHVGGNNNDAVDDDDDDDESVGDDSVLNLDFLLGIYLQYDPSSTMLCCTGVCDCVCVCVRMCIYVCAVYIYVCVYVVCMRVYVSVSHSLIIAISMSILPHHTILYHTTSQITSCREVLDWTGHHSKLMIGYSHCVSSLRTHAL